MHYASISFGAVLWLINSQPKSIKVLTLKASTYRYWKYNWPHFRQMKVFLHIKIMADFFA